MEPLPVLELLGLYFGRGGWGGLCRQGKAQLYTQVGACTNNSTPACDLCTQLQQLCRAQVLLAAAQSPLLAEKKLASVLIPRLCNSILTAPSSSRHVGSRPGPGLPFLCHHTTAPMLSKHNSSLCSASGPGLPLPCHHTTAPMLSKHRPHPPACQSTAYHAVLPVVVACILSAT